MIDPVASTRDAIERVIFDEPCNAYLHYMAALSYMGAHRLSWADVGIPPRIVEAIRHLVVVSRFAAIVSDVRTRREGRVYVEDAWRRLKPMARSCGFKLAEMQLEIDRRLAVIDPVAPAWKALPNFQRQRVA